MRWDEWLNCELTEDSIRIAPVGTNTDGKPHCCQHPYCHQASIEWRLKSYSDSLIRVCLFYFRYFPFIFILSCFAMFSHKIQVRGDAVDQLVAVGFLRKSVETALLEVGADLERSSNWLLDWNEKHKPSQATSNEDNQFVSGRRASAQCVLSWRNRTVRYHFVDVCDPEVDCEFEGLHSLTFWGNESCLAS